MYLSGRRLHFLCAPWVLCTERWLFSQFKGRLHSQRVCVRIVKKWLWKHIGVGPICRYIFLSTDESLCPPRRLTAHQPTESVPPTDTPPPLQCLTSPTWSGRRWGIPQNDSTDDDDAYSPIWMNLCVFQRKPEESPVKEGVVKKVKQDAGQTNGVHKANGET